MAVFIAGLPGAAEEPAVRATLQAAGDREAAPGFELKDSSGRTATLNQYRGKVVLLDFWATWCTGCKKEIPWFSELRQRYGRQGLAVLGVSMDDDGWKAVKPFLAGHRIPYRILRGDELTAKSYGIQGMPDAFLIDRQGRLAATYVAGIVDRDNLESNIKAVLLAH